jgi:hypothetical protein
MALGLLTKSPGACVFQSLRLLILSVVLAWMTPAASYAEPRVSNPFAGLEKETELVASATASVLKRMTFPVTDPGSDRPHRERLFSTLPEYFTKTAPDSELIVGAGPTGDALAYVQDRLWEAKEKNPGVDPREVLRQIIEDTRDIPSHEVMGVGSDLDFLLRAPSTHFPALQKYVASKTKGTADTFAPSKYETAVDDVVFAKDDVKAFNGQMALAIKQGGASVDHMSFSLSKGTFIDPPGNRVNEPLIGEFIRGRLHHLPPSGESERFDSNKQVARTIRVLTKFPWMEMVDESVFRRDLKVLHHLLYNGTEPSERVTKQLLKIVRNGRASNGDNRFHESLRVSLGKKDKPVEAEALQVIQALEARFGQSYMPRVAPARTKPTTPPAVASLQDPRTFILNHTLGDGWLYYPIATPEHALGVMRGNFVVTRQVAPGRDAEGVHLTGDLKEAQRIAGEGGMIMRVQLQRDPSQLRVADWKKLLKDPQVAPLIQKAHRERVHPFAEVSRILGLDVIVDNGEVWVQNARAMEPVQDLSEIIEAYGRIIDNPHADAHRRLVVAASYEQMQRYAESMGAPVSAPRTAQLINELASSDNRSHIEALLNVLPYYAQQGYRFENTTLPEFLSSILINTEGPSNFRQKAVQSALVLPLGVEDLRPYVFVAIQDPDDDVRKSALLTLIRFRLYHPELPIDPALQAAVLRTAAEDERSEVRLAAWSTMAHLSFTDEQVYSFLLNELQKGGNHMSDALKGISQFAAHTKRALHPEFLPLLEAAARGTETHANQLENIFGPPEQNSSMRIFEQAFGQMAASSRQEAFDALALVAVPQEKMLETLRGFARDQTGRRYALKTLARFALVRGEKLTGEARAFVEAIDLDSDIETRMAALHAAKHTDMTAEQLKDFQQKVFFDPEYLKPTIDWSQVPQGSRRAAMDRLMNFGDQKNKLHHAVSGDGRARDVDADQREVLVDLFTSRDKRMRRQAWEHYGYLFFDWDLLDSERRQPKRLSSRMLQLVMPAIEKAAPELQIDFYDSLNKEIESHPDTRPISPGFSAYERARIQAARTASEPSPEMVHALNQEVDQIRVERVNRWITHDVEGIIQRIATQGLSSKNDRLKIAAGRFVFHTAPIGIDGRFMIVKGFLAKESPQLREEGAKLASWFLAKHPELMEALNVAVKDPHAPVRKAAQASLAHLNTLPAPDPQEKNHDRWAEQESQKLSESIGHVLNDLLEKLQSYERDGVLSPAERAGMLQYVFAQRTKDSMVPQLQLSLAKLLQDAQTDPRAIREMLTVLRNANFLETDLPTTRQVVHALKSPEVRRVMTENGQIPFDQALANCLVGLKRMARTTAQ